MKKPGKRTSAASLTPLPVHRPPMLHRRWVEFLVVRGESDDRVHQFLVDDVLPTPASDVLDAMRASLVLPRGFKPQSKTHAPTRAFLEKLGLVEVFDRNPEAQQALRILRWPQPRELVEAAVIGGVPLKAVEQILARTFGMKVTCGALKLYAGIFFDVAMMSRVQLRPLLEERLRHAVLDAAPRTDPKELRRLVASDARMMAMAMPTSELGWAAVLMRLGHTPARLELSEVVSKLESFASIRLGQALLRGGPRDDRRAESCASVLEKVRKIRETVQTPAEELNKRLTQFRLVHATEPQISVHELRERGDEVAVDNMPPTIAVWDRRAEDEGEEEDAAVPPPAMAPA